MEIRHSDQMKMDRHGLLQLITEMENNSEFNKLHEPIKNYDHDMVLRYVKALQNIYFELMETKGRAYGDSWQKHGEAVSIFGNLSRKFDRIQNFTLKAGIFLGDESRHDTLMDLSNYAILWDAFRIIKYLEWLDDKRIPIRDHSNYGGVVELDSCDKNRLGKETIDKFLRGKSDNKNEYRVGQVMECEKCDAKFDLDKPDSCFYDIKGLRNFLNKHSAECHEGFVSYEDERLPNWGMKS